MDAHITIAVVSDVHYACAAEQARGDDYEIDAIPDGFKKVLLRFYRYYIWLRHPLRQNRLLDEFLNRNDDADWVVANGDYSCDTAFVGISDDAAFESVRECHGKLRAKFGERLLATLGDHEFGKFSFVGNNGGMRLASYERAMRDLQLQPFWTNEVGRYVLAGVTSSLMTLPLLRAEAQPEEWNQWQQLRNEHLEEIRKGFAAIPSDRRIILFCHDPTALPFLAEENSVRNKLDQVELTVIGHLHSPLIFWKSRLLAGMPEIRFLGHSIRKMSRALSQAKHWRPFKPVLCPSLAGVELLKDGGYLTIKLDPSARTPLEVKRHRIRR